MKLYRNEKDNAAEVLEALNKCDTISYNRRKNTFTFYAHEGALLEDVENAEHMDLVKLANALDKRYFYEATIGCSNWNWDDEDEEEEKQEDEPKAEDQATETKKEDKHMKKRFFYLSDIDSTFAVTPMAKKEIISIGQELKELCAFISDDQTISGYTKGGRFFYYDNSNFDSFKKSDIINAVSVIYTDESGDYYWGGFDINEWGVAGPTEDGSTIIADHENIKEVDSEDYHEPTAEKLIEAVNELCERTANSRAEVDQMIEETENMMKEQAEALQEARAKDFEAVKPQLFAKVEHITADFPSKSEIVYRTRGEDIAHTIWIDNGVNPPERLSRAALDGWEKSGIVEERHIFEIAMENTMAQQKPRIHAGTMFYDPDNDTLNNSALLESCFNRQNLDKHNDILVTTSEQNNGAIALFYPPVCEKICELLHGAGFYVAFTSKNEGIVHKLDHLEVSAIRRNLQSTNRIFGPADTLTDEVFYYDPIIKRLIPESKTADFEVLRRQVLKGLA